MIFIEVLSKRVKVTDDWFPTREDNTIELNLMIGVYDLYYARILARGEDDYILAITREFKTLDEALKCFDEFKVGVYDCVPLVASKDYFKSLGFTQF